MPSTTGVFINSKEGLICIKNSTFRNNYSKGSYNSMKIFASKLQIKNCEFSESNYLLEKHERNILESGFVNSNAQEF